MPIIKKYRAITDSDIPAAIARDTEFQAADTAHLTTGHPNLYFTKEQGDARYLGAGGGSGIAATIAVSAIESALEKRFRGRFFIESHYSATAGSGDFPSTSGNGGFGYSRSEVDRPGILGLSTGANPAGFAGSATGFGNNSSPFTIDDGDIEYLGILKIPVLRDATNDFTIDAGFQTAGTSIGLDAVCFVYDAASPNWQCYTRNNSDGFSFTSNVPVIANQWFDLKIAVKNGAAVFTINGVDILTTSQKLPLSPRSVGAGIDIRKWSGTTGRDVWIDYQSVGQNFNNIDENIIVQARTLTDADIPATIARDTEVTAAVAAHENITDLHTRCKIFNFSTAATDGGTSFMLHELVASKILGFSILIEAFAGSVFLLPNVFTAPGISSGFKYNAYINNGYIYVDNIPGDSFNLISKPIRAMIWYLP